MRRDQVEYIVVVGRARVQTALAEQRHLARGRARGGLGFGFGFGLYRQLWLSSGT